MESNRLEGQRAEDQAVAHLLAIGWRILERNWRNGRNEIDIIARDHDTIVFVEVKFRHKPIDTSGIPSTAQHHRYLSAASAYLRRFRSDFKWRIDLILVQEEGLTHSRDV